MIKRIIDISDKAYLHIKNRQLLIDKEGATVGRIPVEDLGAVILQHPSIVISQATVIACQTSNVILIFCDQQHLPYSVVLPISEGNNLHSKILKLQVGVKQPVKKRLWQQIVKEKIRQQIYTLNTIGTNSLPIERIADKVKSGDRENHEAQAAQKYWRLLLGDSFRRNVDEGGINALLNYGYAVVRAMVARAIVASGLHPALGIHHQNQYNGLCLADDLMEPFRPWVDLKVYELSIKYSDLDVNTDTKQVLLGLLSESVEWEGKTLPFMVSCHHLMANLKRTYTGSVEKFYYPQLLNRAK